ncbi:MAG: helix-turn-helix domain-containing protein [Bacteroidaceae bacterium]|nr:helix-turn-helix domain-containing protein [Bacteroidaceae bacterium]
MKTEYQIEIIGKVRKLREANQYSQNQLANHLGLSDGQIGNVESLKYSQKYTLSQLYKICKLFHISIEQLFINDDEYSKNINVVDLLIQKIIQYEE